MVATIIGRLKMEKELQTVDTSATEIKTFTQDEVNKIVSERVNKNNEELKALRDEVNSFKQERHLNEANSFLKAQNVNVDEFKELKAYDDFMKLNSAEEKEQFIKDLQGKKPNLFGSPKPTAKNPLSFTGVSYETKDEKQKLKVY